MENNLFEKIANFIRNSIMLKLITITILMLLLLIPASMIKSIIQEREMLSEQVIDEISSKWANEQKITGPILTIPVQYQTIVDDKLVTTIENWKILPENLEVVGSIKPEKLRRGIYEIVVYRSDIKLNGNFDIPELANKKNLSAILYDEAFITLGISDLRGIKNQVHLKWDRANIEAEPGSNLDLIYSGITFDMSKTDDLSQNFEISIDLLGSKNLSFVPVGSTTKVKIDSSWPDPSFNGNYLPDSREITESGFSAEWSVLQLNRNFPQQWTSSLSNKQLDESAFGVDLILPVDDYQKAHRSAKYAVMSIALTFLVFFLVEILNKRKIHPFQYALVGLALCLFYILLVSISEHSSFKLAYLVATLAISAMISLYSLSVFKKARYSVILTGTLVGIYGFLFVTLQIADYALLLGSIGLALILSLTMYFTRNINWYQLKIETN